ncbi:MAG: acyl-CoA dehydrogenase family protein [Longimonas sp.]|uniref:acyl-CoA dehydrogenase family protein n=1 Tax=Longimonas sp. TaxID=2039626 RepID=UPI00335B2E06
MDASTITAPDLKNQFEADRVLRGTLAHRLPSSRYQDARNVLRDEGSRQQQRYASQSHHKQPYHERSHPKPSPEDAWGQPQHVTPVPAHWGPSRRAFTKQGIIHRSQARPDAAHSRLVQMALVHLLAPEAPGLAPLIATTDVAVHTLMRTGSAAHLERLVPRLTSRDPDTSALCDIWGRSHSLSAPDTSMRATHSEGKWRLHGRTYARASTYPDAALVLAQDESETRHLFLLDKPAATSGVHIHAAVPSAMHPAAPSATLRLDNVSAEHLQSDVERVGPAPFLQHVWDAVLSVSHMRRVLALARGAAETWRVQDKELAHSALIQETLADMQARYESAFNLTYRSVRLLDATENGDESSTPLLQPMALLAKHHAMMQGAEVARAALQVWGRSARRTSNGLHAALAPVHDRAVAYGTTHDLALTFLHTLEHQQQFRELRSDLKETLTGCSVETLIGPMKDAVMAFKDANDWLNNARDGGGETLEAGAHRFAVTVGHALSIAFMIEQADWSLREDQDGRPAAAVKRFSNTHINHISNLDPHDAYVLTWDFNCPTLFECHSGAQPGASQETLSAVFGS